jgi:hypothetical protein
MKFTFGGIVYRIEFERNRRKATTTDKGLSPSRMTTVRIYEDVPGTLPGKLFREASSVCAVVDHFEVEKGRVGALRQVSRTVSKGFRTALWNAYVNRFPPKPRKTPSNVLQFPTKGVESGTITL